MTLPEELRKAVYKESCLGCHKEKCKCPNVCSSNHEVINANVVASFLEKKRKELKNELYMVVGQLDSQVDQSRYSEALKGVKDLFIKKIDAVFGGRENDD